MIKVRANEVPERNLNRLTPGRTYEAIQEDPHGYIITDDLGKECYILVRTLRGCSYLDGGQWEVINDDHDGLSREDFFTYQYLDGYTADLYGRIPIDTKCPTWDEVIAAYHKVTLTTSND